MRVPTTLTFTCGVAIALLLISGKSAPAAQLFSFDASPSSPSLAEFIFGGAGPAFSAGPGSTGNGDGGLPLATQTAGGLQGQTPLSIFDLASVYGRQNNVDATTTFFDASLSFTGLGVSSPALNLGGFIIQPLSSGTFTILGSDPPGAAPPAVLLTGLLTNAVLSGLASSPAAATLSNTVTYTGGSIYNALVANGGTTTGDASFSLSLIGSALTIDGVTGFLKPFSASGNGLFSTPVVPEPSTLVLGLLGGLFAIAMSRRRAA